MRFEVEGSNAELWYVSDHIGPSDARNVASGQGECVNDVGVPSSSRTKHWMSNNCRMIGQCGGRGTGKDVMSKRGPGRPDPGRGFPDLADEALV